MYETQYIDQQDQYEQIAVQEEYQELMAEKKLIARFQIGSDDDE